MFLRTLVPPFRGASRTTPHRALVRFTRPFSSVKSSGTIAQDATDDGSPKVLECLDHAERPQVVLYQNYTPWKFRAIMAFSCAQSSYWMFVSYDVLQANLGWLTGNKPGPNAVPNVPDVALADSMTSQLADSFVVNFYTHPAWALLGAGISALMFTMTHVYSSHSIAQISVDEQYAPSGALPFGMGPFKPVVTRSNKKGQRRNRQATKPPELGIRVVMHTMLGGLTSPAMYTRSDFMVPNVMDEKSREESLVPIQLDGYKLKVLLDKNGDFAPGLVEHHYLTSKKEPAVENNPVFFHSQEEFDQLGTFKNLVRYLRLPNKIQDPAFLTKSWRNPSGTDPTTKRKR